MKIYFNRHYTSAPYVDFKTDPCFGIVYCGRDELLSIMMLHGGIVRSTVSSEERKSIYHNNMRNRIHEKQLFYDSFELDSFATSNAVLAWRDALVGAGWDMQHGDTPKLRFIREMEPENMPQGSADYWNKALRLSAERPLFPAHTEIIITQPKSSVEPLLATLFTNQEKFSIRISYRPDERAIAGGNLGKIQQWFLDGQKSDITLDKNDDTLKLLHFDNEEMAFRYVATQPTDSHTLYYCQQAKQFDNLLRLLGQPVCGSALSNCEPQVVQLFTLGNGLFEYPLNLNRILAWLNAPIQPLGRRLCHKLANALVSSGGIRNETWEQVISEHLESFSDKKQADKEKAKIAAWLPFQQQAEVDTETVIAFNQALRLWAIGLLSMEHFPYDEIVREQLRQLDIYGRALLNILQEQSLTTLSFIDLQRWCQSIVSPKSYTQYEAEVGCRPLIASEGDIHATADSLIWFCIEENGDEAYPFDFLTAEEYTTLLQHGVCLYDKTHYSRQKREAMVQMLLRTRRLTLIECAKINGEPLHRHPLMLQLNEAVSGGLKPWFETPTLQSAALITENTVDNRSDELFLRLDEDVVLHPRHEQGKAESYSSLNLLIQHPFDYVCQYNAALGDIGIPTMEDLNRTMGNVAHRIIEKVFERGTDRTEQDRRIRQDYPRIFDEAVETTGLLLHRPEYAIELNGMRKQMLTVLNQLLELIIRNGLTLDACEYPFRDLDWTDAGDGVRLSSRADMLLTDKNGNKVIFDFKWSNHRKKYEKEIETHTALQLAIYRHLAEAEFGCSVRTAYILLPSMTFVSGDAFENNPTVQPLPPADIIRQAARAYAFRLHQLDERRIERAEGRILVESEYGASQSELGLYPLNEYQNAISENRSADFKKLR